VKVELPAGKQTLELHGDDGSVRKMRVVIRAGQSSQRHVALSEI
jgi:hypothetical protein